MTRPDMSRELGEGQVALELDASVLAPANQIRDLARIGDPALSELGFDHLLNELLVRVRELLHVDTAAILLLDHSTDELVARAAKGIEEEVERGVRIPLGAGFAGRIARQRVAIYIADVDHADIMNPILREKGISSLLGVPLIVEGDLIGVLHVGSLAPRVFDARDLSVLELAAARAAPAIERARLLGELEREHRNAVLLQRSLLPRMLDMVPGVSVAARYLPAREEVGGDWYDMIELPGGRVGVVIGDVVGHGLQAAALMGQLRTALHAYALVGHTPGRALELVNQFAISIGPDAMATAAFAVVDSDAETVYFASAGHLPPVVIAADGTARLMEVSIAPPLGAFAYKSCPEHELPFRAGETMLLYTDGLIERPAVSLDHSLEQLVDAVSGANTAEDACLLAMDRLVPQRGPRDDVAVIAVRPDPVTDVLDIELAADPSLLSGLRRMLGRWQRSQDIERAVANEITIAVSEACANAIEHAYGPSGGRVHVRAARIGETIQISVSDRGRWRPPRGEYRGRGLKIMKAVMDSFEARSTEQGTEIVMSRDLSHS
jgi:anti-sigma regulatory factor (Ser/Thr protein kinase)/putative methionine-R-sulfoxide reductase with GAF domain